MILKPTGLATRQWAQKGHSPPKNKGGRNAYGQVFERCLSIIEILGIFCSVSADKDYCKPDSLILDRLLFETAV